MDEISLEKYRTRFPPKEHEEAVRMLLEGIKPNNNTEATHMRLSKPATGSKQTSHVDNKMTIRRHNTQENLSMKPASDLKNSNGLRSNGSPKQTRPQIDNSLKSSLVNNAADSNKFERSMDAKVLKPLNGFRNSDNNSNTNTLPLMRSKGTSTASESLSTGSNSNECNEDDVDNEVGFGDPIPSRTIAVQCDLKLSSVKRGSNSAGEPVFDPSMQASSISATRYGFYRFSAEELENRRQLKRSISSRNIAHSRYHLDEIGSDENVKGTVEDSVPSDTGRAKGSSSELSLSSSSLSHSDGGESRRQFNGNDVVWRRNEELNQRRPETALSFVSTNKLRNERDIRVAQDAQHLSSTESEPSLLENASSTGSRSSRERKLSNRFLAGTNGSLPRKPARATSYQVLNTAGMQPGSRLGGSRRQVRAVGGQQQKIDMMSETEIFESSSDADNTATTGKLLHHPDAVTGDANRRQRLPSSENLINKRMPPKSTLERKYPNLAAKTPVRQEDYETNNNNMSKEANISRFERAMSVHQARDLDQPLMKPFKRASTMSRPTTTTTTTGESKAYEPERSLDSSSNNNPQTNRLYSGSKARRVVDDDEYDNEEVDGEHEVVVESLSPVNQRRQVDPEVDNVQWKYKLSRLPGNERDSNYKLSSLSRRPSQQRPYDNRTDTMSSNGNRFEATRYSSAMHLSDNNNHDSNGQMRRGTLTKRPSDASLIQRAPRASPSIIRYGTDGSANRYEQPVYTAPSSTGSTIKYTSSSSGDTLKRGQTGRTDEYNSLRRNGNSSINDDHVYVDPPKQSTLQDWTPSVTDAINHSYSHRSNSMTNGRKSSRSHSMRDSSANGKYNIDENSRQSCNCYINDDAIESTVPFDYESNEKELQENQFCEAENPLSRQVDDLSSETSSLDEAHRRFAQVAQEHQLDYDSQHKLNESGLPNTVAANDSSSPMIAHTIRSKGASSYLGLSTSNYNNSEQVIRPKVRRSGTMIGSRPVQITGRAMSQQSLTRPTMPMTSGRRMRYGTGSQSGGSDVGGSSMSLVSRLQGRYENAHTRTPVVMYIPQATPKSTRSSSDGLDSRTFGSSLSRRGSKISRKSRSQDRSLRKGNSSRNGSDSETSSMLKTLIKPRNSRLQSSNYNSKRMSRLTNHRNESEEEDMDGVGQLASEMDSYKFRRRYSVPKDAKINWFAKLKQRVTRG